MLINELAKKSGVSAHTIRFYEKSGLLNGKRDPLVKSNNYFHYTDEALERLELIRDAKLIGFTISEIAKLIDVWYGKKISVKQKLAVLDEKLLAIEEKIKDLKDMKKMLIAFKKEVEVNNC
jgi:MerR family transcriptional regulator, copper efflux regulator